MLKNQIFILFYRYSMIKKVILFIFSLFALSTMQTFASSSASSLSNDTPENFLNRIVQTSNSNFKSQQTQLDDVSATSTWGT